MTIDNGDHTELESVKVGSYFVWEKIRGRAYPVLYYSVVPNYTASHGAPLIERVGTPRQITESDYDECKISVRVHKEMGKSFTPVDFFAQKYPLPPLAATELTNVRRADDVPTGEPEAVEQLPQA